MINFEVTNFSLGETPIEKDSVHKVIFPFTGDKNNIVHVQPGCRCTAEIKILEDRIEATYTESSAKHITPEQVANQFPSGILNFSKTITVYFKDDKDLYVEEGMNKRFNSEKEHVDLLISGKVNLK
jgi:hypothetical protein